MAEGAWVHTPSTFVADEVVAEFGVDPERVRAVHHGVPRASPPPTGGDGADRAVAGAGVPALPAGCDRYVVAIGTVEPRKDYPLLVPAFAAVAAEHPDVALLIVGGDGWGMGPFDEALAASPVRSRILRPGYLDDAALAATLRGAAVLAYPSRYEGFGFPPLQAMAAGVPVVATAAGAVPEVVERRGMAGRPGRRGHTGRTARHGPARWGRGRLRSSPGVATGATRFSWDACAGRSRPPSTGMRHARNGGRGR